MNKIFQWLNERTEVEKIGLMILTFAGIVYFLYQIYKYKEEINALEKELRQVQNLQAYYYEKMRLQRKLQELKHGITFQYLSYEDIYSTAEKYKISILEAEKLQTKRFFADVQGEKIILSRASETRNRNQKKGEEIQKTRKSIILEPINLKVMGYNKNMVLFLNELTENKLVSLAGLYSGCPDSGSFERLKFPPKICDVNINQYKNWLCSVRGQNSFYITLLLLKVGE